MEEWMERNGRAAWCDPAPQWVHPNYSQTLLFNLLGRYGGDHNSADLDKRLNLEGNVFNTMFCIWANPPKMIKQRKKVSPSDCGLNTFWDHLDFWGQLRLRTLCNCSKWIYPATQVSPQCSLGPKMHNLLNFFPNRGEGSFLEKFQIISFTSGPFTNLRMHACLMSIYAYTFAHLFILWKNFFYISRIYQTKKVEILVCF